MSSGPGGSALRLWLSCLISLLITFPAFGAEGDLLYAEGLQLLQQGFYQEASRQLERAVRLRPQPDRCF
ncbi:MAG TPA: tetratricopeptide repeat protein, partial [Candidatus Obscuribacterales bacterium]